MISDEQITALEALCEKATPGPWAVQMLTGEKDGSWHLGAGATRLDDEADEPAPLGGVFDDQDGDEIDLDEVICEAVSTTGTNGRADAALIVEMRNLLPSLLEERKGMQRRIAELEAARDSWKNAAFAERFGGHTDTDPR